MNGVSLWYIVYKTMLFGPKHSLWLFLTGASSKCANKLLGLLRKGVADMSPSIKIVLQTSTNNTLICRQDLEITFVSM